MQINFHQGQDIGRREEQQDALGNLVLSPHQKLYVLADGMGGQQGGQLASKTVVNAFLNHFQQQPDLSEPEPVLRAALQAANQALAQQLSQQPELDGMGTTVIALLVDETANRYAFVSVGDSPLYCLCAGGLQRINANHAFYEDLKNMVAAGEMSREEAEQHPARHAVTSAVMGKDLGLMDFGSGQLQPGELLLLASDGIQTLDDAPNGEIQSLLAASGSLEDKVSRLLSAVRHKQAAHQDNTSLILVQAAADADAAVGRSASPTQTPTRLNPETAATRPSQGGLWKAVVAGMLLGVLALAFWWWRSQPVPTEMPQPEPALPDAAEASAVSASLPVPAVLPAPPRAVSEPAASKPAAPEQGASAAKPPAAAASQTAI